MTRAQPEDSGQFVVVLSPHLDDAVLSAWAGMRAVENARVVNVFSGAPADGLLSRWDRLTGATSSGARMLERQAEDRVALARAGRAATSLGFPEEQYRDGPLDSETLRAALRDAVGDADRVWAPAGIGGHADHLLVRDAALALRRAGGPAVTLYAELPYAVRFGWPGWVTGQADDSYLIVEEWWRRFLPVDVELSPSKHVLSPAEASLKRHAIAGYRTQLPALNLGPLGLLERPFIIDHEVSWTVAGDRK